MLRLEREPRLRAACNAGAEAGHAASCWSSSTTTPSPSRDGWQALLDCAAEHPGAEVLGARLLYPTGAVQHAGVAFGQDGYPHNLYAGFPGDHPAVCRPRQLQAVTGACMLVRRPAFERAGGFDESFRNSLEDVDLCLRIGRGGGEVRYCPAAVLTHLESATRGRKERFEASVALYRERWRERVRRDDLALYAEDGLIEVEYPDGHPLRISVSPLLAAIERARPSRGGAGAAAAQPGAQGRGPAARADQAGGRARRPRRRVRSSRASATRTRWRRSGPRSSATSPRGRACSWSAAATRSCCDLGEREAGHFPRRTGRPLPRPPPGRRRGGDRDAGGGARGAAPSTWSCQRRRPGGSATTGASPPTWRSEPAPSGTRPAPSTGWRRVWPERRCAHETCRGRRRRPLRGAGAADRRAGRGADPGRGDRARRQQGRRGAGPLRRSQRLALPARLDRPVRGPSSARRRVGGRPPRVAARRPAAPTWSCPRPTTGGSSTTRSWNSTCAIATSGSTAPEEVCRIYRLLELPAAPPRVGAGPRGRRRCSGAAYRRRAPCSAACSPDEEVVLVLSEGDDALLALDRPAWHFPHDAAGRPVPLEADGGRHAVTQLRTLGRDGHPLPGRSRGAALDGGAAPRPRRLPRAASAAGWRCAAESASSTSCQAAPEAQPQPRSGRRRLHGSESEEGPLRVPQPPGDPPGRRRGVRLRAARGDARRKRVGVALPRPHRPAVLDLLALPRGNAADRRRRQRPRPVLLLHRAERLRLAAQLDPREVDDHHPPARLPARPAARRGPLPAHPLHRPRSDPRGPQHAARTRRSSTRCTSSCRSATATASCCGRPTKSPAWKSRRAAATSASRTSPRRSSSCARS